jgi:hypothetical protein
VVAVKKIIIKSIDSQTGKVLFRSPPTTVPKMLAGSISKTTSQLIIFRFAMGCFLLEFIMTFIKELPRIVVLERATACIGFKSNKEM